MQYPLINEYIESIRFAEDNLDSLNHLRPVLDDGGNPIMSSGNFAVVFKMTDGKKNYAIKCFTREQEGRAEAYQQICEELEFVSSSFLCTIKYYDRELFVDSKSTSETEFPVLLMDWVEGVPLDRYVKDHLNDQYTIGLLCYQFCRMAQWLMTQSFAHGDLKPDNILVQADGSMVLVDYDGMFVPAMQGQKARELGSPNYRHPLRTENDFDEHIDDFALCIIALSLKALSLQPSLHHDYGSADRLLFSDADYRDLGGSQLIPALQALMADSEFNRLYALFLLCHSQQTLTDVSYKLFGVAKPEKPAIVEILSTKVTKEDRADAWKDEYGVKYSRDGKRLLKATVGIEDYIIREGTVTICDYAFSRCSSLTSITIPGSVTSIGISAFQWCRSLASITLPNSVTSIGERAFSRCRSLASITLPNSVTSIGDRAFSRCTSLSSITIPGSVTSIGNSAFRYCESLASITLPNSVTSIGNSAFRYCTSLASITIPDSVTSIGDFAFSGCSSLASITIPDSVTAIGEGAFWGCEFLSSITILDSVTAIGEDAFWGCKSLASITIPDSVTAIGAWAFCECSSLSSITLLDSVTSIGKSAFDRCSSLASVTLPDSVTSIGERAFDRCRSLASITIPGSVTSIGDSTFCFCESLASIIIPNSVTSIGDSAFYGCRSLASITIPNSVTAIGEEAFSRCKSLQSITIPRGTRSKFEKLLPEYANILVEKLFGVAKPEKPAIVEILSTKVTDEDLADAWEDDYGVKYSKDGKKLLRAPYDIEDYTIREGTVTICDQAFWRCKSLASITIPDSMTSIGGYAFCHCTSLASITIPRGTRSKFEKMLPEYVDILVEEEVTEVTKEDRADAWEDEYGVKYSRDGKRLLETTYDIEDYIIRDGTVTICDHAFKCCKSLSSITIPDSVTSIGDYAFEYCKSLASINLPNSVTSIGKYAFCHCRSLASITVPNSVTAIGYGAFSGCNLSLVLKTAHYSTDGICLFDRKHTRIISCHKSDIKIYTIPDSVTSIGDSAFYDCDSLASITLPNSVTSIGYRAFLGCKSLAIITIPDSVTSIGGYAFCHCTSLESITIPRGTRSKFEKMLSRYDDILVEED